MVMRRALALVALALLAAAAPPPPDGVVDGRFRLPDRPPYAGEVFTLDFVWTVDWDRFRYLDGDLAWVAGPLASAGWQRQPLQPPRRDGERSVAELVFRTRALALTPGTIRLAPVSQQLQIATGSYVTSGVTIATIGPVAARGQGASLTIQPLPPAPPNFSGAVGDFALHSRLDRRDGAVGKPMVWTLCLSGSGNWAGIAGVPSRPLPVAFDLVGAPTTTPGPADSLFERTICESLTIVPRQAGRFGLGPVEMRVFDPAAGRYRTIAAPPIALTVAPGAAGPAPPAYDPVPPPIPSAAERLPLLRGVGHAPVPMPGRVWRALVAGPPLALLLLWGVLATLRARALDPDAAARRADAGLRRTLAAFAAADAGRQRRALLRDWQRQAARRLGVGHAAPTAAMLAPPAWARLWAEAESHLYGAAAPLPPDWPDRAGAALAAAGPPPRFDPRRIITRGNLLPVLALVIAMVAATAPPLAAADRSTPLLAPGDWIGHYQRGRAAAVAGQWPRAAAHAGIAWVQAPGSPATTRLWTLAAREAGGRPATGLPRPDDPAAVLVGLLPARDWQALALLAMLLAGIGGGGLLLHRFGHLSGRWRRRPGIVAVIGGVGVVLGLAGVHGHGVAADPAAAVTWRPVVLRPLPVATPDGEVRVALPPGTAGHMDAAFLGWVRLELADGRAGWLRRADLVPVWQATPAR